MCVCWNSMWMVKLKCGTQTTKAHEKLKHETIQSIRRNDTEDILIVRMCVVICRELSPLSVWLNCFHVFAVVVLLLLQQIQHTFLLMLIYGSDMKIKFINEIRFMCTCTLYTFDRVLLTTIYWKSAQHGSLHIGEYCLKINIILWQTYSSACAVQHRINVNFDIHLKKNIVTCYAVHTLYVISHIDRWLLVRQYTRNWC